MADAITIKALQDASLDAKSLEDVVNGDEAKQVTTRKGETYPSVKKAIKTLFENGGLPATPFATKALMTASSLEDNKYAMVTDDTVNNGLYVKTAGAWVKSPYDPVVASNTYTREYSKANASKELAKIRSINVKKDALFIFADINERPLAYLDRTGQMHLMGLDNSVQNELNETRKSMEATDSSLSEEPVFVIEDSEERHVLRIDHEGGLNLAGLKYTVQDYLKNNALNDKVVSYTSPTKGTYSKADSYTPDIAGQLAYLKTFKEMAEVPLGTFPQQYVLNDKWINNINLTLASNRTVIGAYQGFRTATNWNADSGVVHPCVIEFEKPFKGCKYWMVINPYSNTNENREIPYVYGTNDDELENWELIDGLPQPFDGDPLSKDDDPSVDSTSGHLSDPVFTYDPNTGELWVIWRKNLYFDGGRSRVTAKQSYWGRKTLDAITWSDKIEVFPEYTDLTRDVMLSPAIVYNPSDALFYMYSVALNSGGKDFITLRKASRLENPDWSEPQTITGCECVPWHLEAKWVGDSIVLFVYDFDNDYFVFLTSKDGVVFKQGQRLLEGSKQYKGSFVPRFNESGEMQLRVLSSTNSKGNSTTPPAWVFYVSKTNYINVR